MSFSQFIFRNTVRNKQLYLGYFLSTLITVMTFTTFMIITLHPALPDEIPNKLKIGLFVAAAIIYVFSFIFVYYSMDVFLHARKREFGLLLIQGMSAKQLRKMIFGENMVIGLFSTGLGCLLGIVFSQVIMVMCKQILHIHFPLSFPLKAIILTLLSFELLFVILSKIIQFRLPKMNVNELLKSHELGKGKIKISKSRAIASCLLIGIGYLIALFAQGGLVVLAMFPAVIVVTIGTYFLYTQGMILFVNKVQKKKKLFWKNPNLVIFSDLAFRMRDNARSFFFVSIISTAAIAASGTLYAYNHMIFNGMLSKPYEFGVTEKAPTVDRIADEFNRLLKENNINVDRGIATIYFDNLIGYIKEKDYNKMAEMTQTDRVKVGDYGIQLMPIEEDLFSEETPDRLTAVTLPNGASFQVDSTLESNLISLERQMIIVPNEVDLSMLTEQSKMVIWQPHHTFHEDLVEIGKFQESHPNFIATSYTIQETIDSNAPILMIGIFVSIVFFISAGSFLYFRLYSDLVVDVKKFKQIYKIGLSKAVCKRMIYNQVGILLFTPIIISLIHGVVALTAMYHLFGQSMQLQGGMVLIAFAGIQLLYYLIARRFYFKKIYHQIIR
ncbi:FtsX-like permease family protein [Bacillus sp. XF8]|uniref:FtsX-like permease family protein n=1 Tax=Bacillus sp. XF8 TaxID=2819289 RepID=UPI001AA077C8|nr:ABC transporter permease [Bacillus sp. XF8]MBO1583249.1 ABC transporter permease [Bacillus sp. XF8]